MRQKKNEAAATNKVIKLKLLLTKIPINKIIVNAKAPVINEWKTVFEIKEVIKPPKMLAMPNHINSYKILSNKNLS